VDLVVEEDRLDLAVSHLQVSQQDKDRPQDLLLQEDRRYDLLDAQWKSDHQDLGQWRRDFLSEAQQRRWEEFEITYQKLSLCSIDIKSIGVDSRQMSNFWSSTM
jgi:hypothetical protein